MPKVSKVDRAKLGHEVKLKISRDKDVTIGTRRYAEKVRDHWVKHEAPRPGPAHPYSTGDADSYIASIEVTQDRDTRKGGIGRYLSSFTVGTNHPHANFIEYGTGPDKPGSRSPWGPNTPTPEFAPAAKTAHHFRGTAP